MSILDQFNLDGQVALVTGGSKGLGKEMAQALAEAGAQVAVLSRNGEQSQAVAAGIQEATGNTCRGYSCDVTVEEQVNSTVEQILADFGQIDIAINNAGINIRGHIDELDFAEFQHVQDVNVNGVWLACKAVVPHMKSRGYGRIINIGSALSLIAIAERTPYNASKGAVLMMTRALALELASHNITVNAILPGSSLSQMALARWR
ncbi:MAG: SDR family oxidoreductase [Chloroflexota bacterium]